MDPAANVTVGASSSAPEDAIRAQETIRQIERAATEKAAEIERLERGVPGTEGVEPQAAAPEPEPNRNSSPNLRQAAASGRRRRAAGNGNRLNVDGVDYAVAKLRRSPLPATCGASPTFSPPRAVRRPSRSRAA